MKMIRRILCMLMAAFIMLQSPVSILAEEGVTYEPDGLPASDQPMIYNTTDSSRLPTYQEPEDFHGVVDSSNAEEVNSLFSSSAFDEFSRRISLYSDFEPVEEQDVSQVLGRVGSFLQNGGLNAHKQGNDLQGQIVGQPGQRIVLHLGYFLSDKLRLPACCLQLV